MPSFQQLWVVIFCDFNMKEQQQSISSAKSHSSLCVVVHCWSVLISGFLFNFHVNVAQENWDDNIWKQELSDIIAATVMTVKDMSHVSGRHMKEV